MLRRILLLSSAVLMGACAVAQAQPSDIIGTVIDTTSKQPIAGVNVTAISPILPEPKSTATGAQGDYRLAELPAGVYTLTYEHSAYKPYARIDFQLRINRTVRVNVELMPRSAGQAAAPESGKP